MHNRRIFYMKSVLSDDLGDIPKAICFAVKSKDPPLKTEIWVNENRGGVTPPWKGWQDRDTLVAYSAIPELSCISQLGLPPPPNVIDLCVEFRNIVNGDPIEKNLSLLDALKFFDIQNGIIRDQKDSILGYAIRDRPFSSIERQLMLGYCSQTVDAIEDLHNKMAYLMSTDQALLRGKYIKEAARIEKRGIPIDHERFKMIVARWEEFRLNLIEKNRDQFDVYTKGRINASKLYNYAKQVGVAWPLMPNGMPKVNQDTFREMAQSHPALNPLRQFRTILDELKITKLQVGSDGRNRYKTGVFGSKTGRNQPSSTKCIFGQPRWLRSLIRPSPGMALAYIDYRQQEFGMAAALSRDKQMMKAYRSCDPYMACAIQVGSAPAYATKDTHPEIRSIFKEVVLATQYGMGPISLAKKLNIPQYEATKLLKKHRSAYKAFWAWNEQVLNEALFDGHITTINGWKMKIGPHIKELTIRNFPIQANGAEMLRKAVCLAGEKRVNVIAMVHDAVLIEAAEDQIEQDTIIMQEAMKQASLYVLNEFTLDTDAKIIKHPETFNAEGNQTWNLVWSIINEIEAKKMTMVTSHENEKIRI